MERFSNHFLDYYRIKIIILVLTLENSLPFPKRSVYGIKNYFSIKGDGTCNKR